MEPGAKKLQPQGGNHMSIEPCSIRAHSCHSRKSPSPFALVASVAGHRSQITRLSTFVPLDYPTNSRRFPPIPTLKNALFFYPPHRFLRLLLLDFTESVFIRGSKSGQK